MNPVAFSKIIFALLTTLAFVFPMILISEVVTPWSEARAELTKLYPSEMYLALESTTEEAQTLSSGEVIPAFKMKSYLVLPSNKTMRFTKKANEKVIFEEVENFTIKYLLINIFLLMLFFFVGLPILRDWAGGKLTGKQV